MIVAQRRRDKDIEHLPEKRDKSKLRDDRKKPVGIDSKDPDLNDTKRDPDLKSGGIQMNGCRRLMTARMLVRMARVLMAYDKATKKYKMNGNDEVAVDVIWNDGSHFCDVLKGYEMAANIVDMLDKRLGECGVKRVPDRGDGKFNVTDDMLTVHYDVSNASGDWEKALKDEGFRK